MTKARDIASMLTSTQTLANKTLASTTTFPAGHIVNHWHKTTTVTSNTAFSFSTASTWYEITYGSTEFTITGITATQNNVLHISVMFELCLTRSSCVWAL